MKYNRLINLTRKNSLFLVGARGVGKTSLVNTLYTPDTCFSIDLLNLDWEEKLSLRPQYLREVVLALPSHITHVLIDEIQKLPKLLDVIHALIESTSLLFILTGSSAKKLRAAGVNLLAGRAFFYELYPLSFIELGADFDLNVALSYGALPKIFQLDDQEKVVYLRSYTQVYLKEEIWNEHLVRKLPPFRKFLEVAAQSNGKIINMANIARDVGADDKTVAAYYQILEDTLLGFFLEPFKSSFRKRLALKPKFYFFDTGVMRALTQQLNIPVSPGTSYYGELFEHYLICEIKRLCSYLKPDYRLYFLQTQNNVEIDLVIERPGKALLLIEIKSSTAAHDEHIKKLKKIAHDLHQEYEAVVLCQESVKRLIDTVIIYPWQEGIKTIFELE
jgi:predicted AAA+ superfamily ATPase